MISRLSRSYKAKIRASLYKQEASLYKKEIEEVKEEEVKEDRNNEYASFVAKWTTILEHQKWNKLCRCKLCLEYKLSLIPQYYH